MTPLRLSAHIRRCPGLALRRTGRPGFAGDAGGIATVEFSLVAVPLFMLIAVIMEASILVFAQHGLDVSVERAARLLRTGAFQDGANGSDPSARLRQLLCGARLGLYRCDDLRLDLVRTASFSAKQIVPPYDAERGDWAAGFGNRFDCPTGGSVIMLRAAVPVLRPFNFLDFTGQRMPGGRQLLMTTTVFRTEGYPDKPCT
ncbi:TadE/TadG family type IV pilus assembly protein [Methylobacterium sp. Leaf118]|uniref:TadE/TadG family type IV pilus assembly protein n=1 Tax=Methylobacterium sp. Leaf118 TaxID=2876562 RepID=UPI001E33BFC8|nr:TadE/TadG family type IV pilus assembly protein [Methylobacterium sp. Leaf118]